MPKIPECLNRRYQALDELIKELSSSMSAPNSKMESGESENVGVKMMCDFWNILKENPSCNLKREVEERMCPKRSYYNSFGPRRVTCYMAGQAKKDDNDKNRENLGKVKNSCCRGTAPQPEQKDKCCASKSVSPSIGSDALPLSKVLCNLKEAASFDRKCQARVNDLMETQKMLQEQIQHLEHREKEGIQLLKQADCMWSCMEDAYKKKIAESLERQKTLLKQLKEVETSATKWRKNKKDLELQMDSVNKFQQEIIEKTHQKTNDIKCLDTEIEDFKKRIEGNKKDAETAKKSINIKKNASNAKVAAIANDITRVQKQLQEEKRNKMLKEQEGANYIKEAREDLQKICRVLLQRKLENEDLKAEKEALVLEIDMLKQVCEQCSEKCKVKQESINEEIRKLELEIANFKVKCIRCHECTDTADVRKFCTDCPRCVEERDCLYKDGHCNPDHTMDCVCMTVKHKFLDNVFDNMYTVLERQTKTNSGKIIADAVMNCLKRSRNGKLNEETRKLVQEFILTTVKKNLNLTIIGGAVKTRCEMDPETYKQLMLCLKQVKVSRPPKVDKGTVAKKEVCRRWGGTGECNCPKGPKACICLKKAPPPPGDPTPCPQDPEDKEAGQIKACPHKESTAYGTDCAMHTAPDCVGTEIASKRPDPCQGQSCPFSKNMRAAQCVLGPESLSSIPVPKASRILNDVSCLDNEVLCSCGNTTKVPCVCPTDAKQLKAGVNQCDISTCPLIWIDSNEQGERIFSQEHKSDKNTVNEADIVFDKRSNIAIKNMNISQIFEEALNSRKCSCQSRLKVWILNENGQMEEHVTELIHTSSNILTIELDERIIELIEKRTRDDPNLLVTLKKTNTGQFIVDFNPKELVSNDCQKIVIKRSPSGTMCFEVEKNFVDVLKPGIIRSTSKINLENKSSVSIAITKKKNDSSVSAKKIESESQTPGKIFEKYNSDRCVRKLAKKSMEDLKVILNNNYKQNMKNVTLKICDEQVFKYVEVEITKTPSEHMAMKMKNLPIVDKFMSEDKEKPVLVMISDSDTILLDFRRERNNKLRNAILRKISDEILLILKNPIGFCEQNAIVTEEKSPNESNTSKKKQCFKMKVKSTDNNVTDPPAVLKLTSSENYIIVVDKEFEKKYNETINNAINKDYNCPVDLTRSESGNYIISLYNNKSLYEGEHSAYLVKSSSGIMKVVVNGPKFNEITQSSSKRHSECTSSMSSSKTLEELLNNLPRSSTEFHRENIKKSRLTDLKSNSDSYIFEKVKLSLQNQQSLMAKSSALLKKTESGQYAVILNKESKKSFVNNLKSYLARSSKELIPIKRTESGVITIMLNNEESLKDQYGSLRITSSGNIYVIVDEQRIKDMKSNLSKEAGQETSEDVKKSVHIIGVVINPLNKAVTTTCNAQPNDCSCDPHKCVCKELKEKKWFLADPDKCEHVYSAEKSDTGSPKSIHPDVCTTADQQAKCSHNNKNEENHSHKSSPHIVIKPFDSISDKKAKTNKQCFFMTESVCPFHKDRYDNVSNELLVISGLCNKAKINKKTLKQKEKRVKKESISKSQLDYFHSLPPQLPSFLKDFSIA